MRFVQLIPGWWLFREGVTYRWSIKEKNGVREHKTAVRIIAQSYKVTAEHLLCSLKCIMAMSSTEAFKLRVLIKLVRGRDEKWMTALGLSLRINDCWLSPVLAELTVSRLSPAYCPLRRPIGCVEAQMRRGDGGILLQWALILYLIEVEMEQ